MKLADFNTDLIQRARQIRLLVLDVDGVLTDGKLYFSNNGDELKAFHSLDGHGVKMLQKAGLLSLSSPAALVTL
jgi:3-deoxy-D-manno-octulosonate 8-phosphate phosphatase (KDO 8-P phosphatase)